MFTEFNFNSWVYNFFVKLFKSKIRQSVEKAVANAILTTLTSQADFIIKNFPTEQTFENKVIVRFPLIQNPIFSNIVDLGFKGTTGYVCQALTFFFFFLLLKGDAVATNHPNDPYNGPVTRLPAQLDMPRMLSVSV